MNTLLIIVACIAGSLVAEVGAAYYFLAKELRWLRLVLIPFLANIADHLNPDHSTLPGDNPPT